MTDRPLSTQLNNLSKKAAETRRVHLIKKQATQVNETVPLHIPRRSKDVLSQKSRHALALKPQETYALPKKEGAALPKGAPSKEIYDGKELRPFDGRPGAMIAFSLPSRGL